MNMILVRRPSTRLAEGIVTHIERSEIDVDRARAQWSSYVMTMQTNGWTPVEVPPADHCPDGVFIEDAVVMFDRLAVLTNPGHEVRRLELEGVGETLRDLGYRVKAIGDAGTLDGGDVLKVGSVVYVGLGGRTNEAGIERLERLVGRRRYRVRAVPVTKVLHLKSAVTALPDGTVIGWEPVVDDPSCFATFLPMPEEQGAHVVLLDGTTLLMSAAAPESADLLRRRGYRVIETDISEFEKLEGCVTCLSVRIRA